MAVSHFFCYITDAFAVWGGMERVLADKMNYLVEQYNYDVILLTINQGDHNIPFFLNSAIKYLDLGIRMHRQYSYRGFARLIIRQKLKRLLMKRMNNVIRELSPDLIVCVKLDFVGLLLKLKGKIPLIVESHTMCHSEMIDGSGWLRRLHIWLFKRNVCKAETVVALTEGDAKDWRLINRNVFVIPNVVRLNGSSHLATLTEKIVVFVGRFSIQKDFESLLRIWAIVHKRYPVWMLNIYGEGELKEYYLPIIKSQDSNINVFEPVGNIMDIYMRSSILVLTSLYEPFGLVLPEAMSCGLPVVSFDCPYGPASIITDGEDGFVVPNRSVDIFADRVCSLIADDNLRCRMGIAAAKSASHYSANIIMPQWNQLFESLS